MKHFLLTLLCFAVPLGAQAIQVKNFTDSPQVIELERNPGSVQRETIPPHDSIYLTGRGYIRMADKPVEGNVSRGFMGGLFGPGERGLEALKRDLFIIWDDGVLTHQMRRKSLGGY